MRRWVLAAVVLLMAAGGAGAADTWESNTDIISGLSDSGDNSDPTIFQKDSTWYLLSGDWDRSWYAFNWTGSTWQDDTGIVSGLGDIGQKQSPAIFQMGGTWYLIAGTHNLGFKGYDWTGATWSSNASMVSGLPNIGEYIKPTVFQMGGTWYLIASAEHPAEYNYYRGYDWSGSEWVYNSTIHSGLVAISNQPIPNPTTFQMGGTWYLIEGTMDNVFKGYNWTGSTWQVDTDITSGLGCAGGGYEITPYVFQKDSKYYLISGEEYGDFYGFMISLPAYGPINLDHTIGFFWINHTWEHGDVVADSYNVSVNDTWYNGTTNTWYNNTLSAFNQWSNITVYGYNATYGLHETYVTEDVELVAVPPTPIGTGSTWDFFWVNHTWTSGTGYVTDSYNVSVNDVWHNSTDEYYNNTLSDWGDWSNITVYAFNNTGAMSEAYIYQNVQIPYPVPPTPTGLDNTWDFFWINHTWTSGAGYITDSYNVSVNDTWYNDTTNEYYNNTLSECGDWSNITVYAFNNSGGINETSVSQNVQLPCFVPSTPTGLDSTQGLFWINHTWTSGAGYITDSYNVSVNDTWYNDTTNEYYNDVLNDYEDWSNITVYAFNNTFGRISETSVSQNIQIEWECLRGYTETFEEYTLGELDGQFGWVCVFGSMEVIEIAGNKMVQVNEHAEYRKQIDTVKCEGYYGEIFMYPHIPPAQLYVVFSPTLAYAESTDGLGMKLSRAWHAPVSYHIYARGTDDTVLFYEPYDTNYFTMGAFYANVFPDEKYISFNTFYPDSSHTDIVIDTNLAASAYTNGLNYVVLTQTFTSGDPTQQYALVDDLYLEPIPPGTLYENIILKDAYGNYIENCELAVYSVTSNEYTQKWTLLSGGILRVEGSQDEEYIITARTFDGVFTKNIMLDAAGSGLHEFTIPLNYNINVVPVDEYDKPLHNVFVGLFEYAIADPQVWWGYDTFWGHVPVTNCSGFSRCDIIAEKGGYQDYEVTALNWTSRSAMIKDYRHTVVLEAE